MCRGPGWKDTLHGANHADRSGSGIRNRNSILWRAVSGCFPFKGQPEQQISVKGWAAINSLDWAADGKSLFVSSQTPTSTTLLRVDLLGLATPLWDQRGSFRTWAIVAPNGRDLAIAGMTSRSNVWIIENY